jgi:hypothetical protein
MLKGKRRCTLLCHQYSCAAWPYKCDILPLIFLPILFPPRDLEGVDSWLVPPPLPHWGPRAAVYNNKYHITNNNIHKLTYSKFKMSKNNCF